MLARYGGATAAPQAASSREALAGLGLDAAEVLDDDEAAWAAQRAGQRADTGAVLRVSTLQTGLPAVLRAADRHHGRVVSRAGLGLCWLALAEREPDDLAAAVTELRAELSPVAVRRARCARGAADGGRSLGRRRA